MKTDLAEGSYIYYYISFFVFQQIMIWNKNGELYNCLGSCHGNVIKNANRYENLKREENR